MPKQVEKYSLGKTLGKGTFSRVRYGKDTTAGGKAYAVKIVDRSMVKKENMEKQLKMEIAVMKLLKHENIVQMREVLQSSKHIYIVLELVTGGELFDRIVAKERFDEAIARKYFQQLISAIEHTHKQGIAHRDLKPENLLLDGNDDLKVSDFGLSALSASSDGSQKVLMTTCGTPNYVAPEVIFSRGYNGFQADVWSCGVILYVMLAGYLPFEADNMNDLFKKIKSGVFTFPSHFSHPVKKLITQMLIVNPKKRITVSQILEDPWFKKGCKLSKSRKIDMSGVNLNESIRITKDAVDLPEEVEEKSIPSQPMNAFDLFGSITKGVVNPLVSGVIRRETRFAMAGSLEEILSAVGKALKKIGIHFKPKGENQLKGYMQKETLITFVVEVNSTSGGFSMVEIRRRKGDILLFNQFYRTLVKELDDMILKNQKK